MRYKLILLSLVIAFFISAVVAQNETETTTTTSTTTSTTSIPQTTTTYIAPTTTTTQVAVTYYSCNLDTDCVKVAQDGSILQGTCIANYCQDFKEQAKSISWIPSFLKPTIKHGPLSFVLDRVLIDFGFFQLTIRILLLAILLVFVIFFLITHLVFGIVLVLVWALMAFL
jgi:hypothetical protein